MTAPGRPSQRTQVLGGTAALVTALVIAVEVHTHPEDAHAPLWIADVAAAAFALAGASLLAGAVRSARGAWLAAVGASAALLVIALWVALGGGERACSLSFTVLRGSPGNLLCRGAFGVGALLLGLLIALLLRRGRQSFPDR